jgi:hypothetical protein
MWDFIKRHSDQIISCVLGLATLLLYMATLAPSVLVADGGEFQFAAPLAGIAHPTGYPLYLILGWLWTTLLPVDSPAWSMNLFSALAAAATVAVLYLTVRRTLKLAGFRHRSWLSQSIAALASILFAVSYAFWSQATIAEVYALNAFFVALIACILLGWVEHGLGWKDLIPLAVALGLGLTHHRTVLLLAPALIFTVWLVEREARRRRLYWKHALILLGLTALPLLLYLYIPLRAPHSPYLTVPLTDAEPLVLYQNTWSGFFEHVLGSRFGGAIRPALLEPARARMAFDLLRQQFGLVGIGLGAVGLGYLVFSRRRVLVSATLGMYLVQLMFNLVYDIGDIAVFFIPGYLIWTLWIGVGIAAICRQAGRLLIRWRRSPTHLGPATLFNRFSLTTEQVAGWTVFLILLALPATLMARNLPALNRHSDWSAWTQWQRILTQPLPDGAVLISNDRDEIMPLWYVQQIQSARTDLIGLFPGIVGDGEWEDIGMVTDKALESGRPVYLIKPMPGLAVKYDLAEAPGDIYHVWGRLEDAPAMREADLVLGDQIRLSGFDRMPYSAQPGQDLSITLRWQPLTAMDRDYSSFVQLLDRSGTRVAGSDRRPGGAFYPTTLWKPGETLYDTHRFAIPDDLEPGAYTLYAGMYEYPSMARLGDGTLGFVGVKRSIETEVRIPPHVLMYSFADQILLWGYELRKEGQSILLSLEWQALKEISYPYTTFIHLVDAEGEIVSQADGQPIGGTYPTSIWDVNEVVIDAYRMPIEMDMPAGEYRLLIGLYRLETLDRLPIYDAEGNLMGDFAELQVVELP